MWIFFHEYMFPSNLFEDNERRLGVPKDHILSNRFHDKGMNHEDFKLEHNSKSNCISFFIFNTEVVPHEKTEKQGKRKRKTLDCETSLNFVRLMLEFQLSNI